MAFATGPKTLDQLIPLIVSGEFGILNHLIELRLSHIEPDLHVGVAKFADPYILSRGVDDPLPTDLQENQSTGAGLDRESMLWSTIGEAIERYAGSFVELDRIEYASLDDLEGAALDPRDAILFADWQYQQQNFPFNRFQPDLPYGWVQGFNLTRGTESYVPAHFAYLGYQPKYQHEQLDNGYSTGLAAGPTLAAAIYSGILEVVERDAFSCHWLTGICPPRIDVEAISGDLPSELQPLLEVNHVDLNIRNFTTDLNVPTVLTVLKAGNDFGFSLGAASHPVHSRALEKSVVESFHTFNWMRDLKLTCDYAMEAADVTSFSDHLQFYLNEANHGNLDFLYANAAVSDSDSFSTADADPQFADREQLHRLVDQLRASGLEVFVVDVTTDDVLELGFHVAKVVIPGLHPISCGVGNEQLDLRRLRQFADSCGYEMPSTLNLAPHVFP